MTVVVRGDDSGIDGRRTSREARTPPTSQKPGPLFCPSPAHVNSFEMTAETSKPVSAFTAGLMGPSYPLPVLPAVET